MNADESTPLDEHVTPLLVACDKALAAGAAAPGAPAGGPPELRTYLEQGLA